MKVVGKPVETESLRLLLAAICRIAFVLLVSIAIPPPAFAATATDVSSGGSHTCAITSSGTAECWGNNNYGQLGNASPSPITSSTHVQVSGLSGVTALAAGDSHTCAIVGNGQVKCWGKNDSGQLGSVHNQSNPDMPYASAVG